LGLSTDAIIRAEHLTKWFRVGFFGRRVRAVDDLSLEVHRGEIFGLLGPNGAGKTTTIKMLLGFVRPTRGAAWVVGHPVESLASRRRLGYLPENPALYEFLTGIEYLRYAGRLTGLSAADARRRTDQLLEEVGLAGRADRRIRRFSKGMVQRLALAQALIGDPELVILDEPMSGLDPIGRKDVRDIIFRLRKDGRTVLFSTHILSDVEAACDRVGIVVEGRLTDCGSLADLVEPGARAIEVVARNLPEPVRDAFASDGAQVLVRDRDIILTFDQADKAQAAAKQVIASGAELVSLTPHRRTLEELFVERARASATQS
jgi:ABC-2 type transport system ATP-binding protein